MDYGALVTRAWQLTWRHRFLWILGLFAVTTTGTCAPGPGGGVQYTADERDVERFLPGVGHALDSLAWWIVDNWALLIALALLGFLVGLAFFVVSLIAQGAMAQATTDLPRGRPSGLGPAWQAGVRFFWRFLGLWLLLLVAMIVFGLLVAIPAGLGALAFLFGNGAGIPVMIIFILIAVLAVLLFIPLGIAATIVVAYAQRAIVVEDVGPWTALGSGIGLLRHNLGTSLIVWLVNIALGIGAAIAMGIAAVVLLIPLGGIAALLIFTTGLSVAAILYVVVAFVAFLAAMWVLGAIVNTYFWNYWSLTYLQLRGLLQPREGGP